MIEGDILGDDGSPAHSYAMGFQLDEDRIARALVFRCDPVEDNADTVDDNVTGVDIRQKLNEYFAELDAARFENATTYFSERVLYTHPPYSPGTPRVAFRGRAELLDGFRRRGAQPCVNIVDVSVQRGPFLMVEGHDLVDGTSEGPTGSFISSATVDAAGKILRYVAFSTERMVAR
jgi:hypothetical protein